MRTVVTRPRFPRTLLPPIPGPAPGRLLEHRPLGLRRPASALAGLLLLGLLLAPGCGDDASSSSAPDAALVDSGAPSIDGAPALDATPPPDADPLVPDGGARSCGGVVGNTCDEKSYCDYPDDQCGQANLGTCVPRPDLCQPAIDEVCGCDGRSYKNQCEAYRSGTDISAQGGCGT